MSSYGRSAGKDKQVERQETSRHPNERESLLDSGLSNIQSLLRDINSSTRTSQKKKLNSGADDTSSTHSASSSDRPRDNAGGTSDRRVRSQSQDAVTQRDISSLHCDDPRSQVNCSANKRSTGPPAPQPRGRDLHKGVVGVNEIPPYEGGDVDQLVNEEEEADIPMAEQQDGADEESYPEQAGRGSSARSSLGGGSALAGWGRQANTSSPAEISEGYDDVERWAKHATLPELFTRVQSGPNGVCSPVAIVAEEAQLLYTVEPEPVMSEEEEAMIDQALNDTLDVDSDGGDDSPLIEQMSVLLDDEQEWNNLDQNRGDQDQNQEWKDSALNIGKKGIDERYPSTPETESATLTPGATHVAYLSEFIPPGNAASADYVRKPAETVLWQLRILPYLQSRFNDVSRRLDSIESALAIETKKSTQVQKSFQTTTNRVSAQVSEVKAMISSLLIVTKHGGKNPGEDSDDQHLKPRIRSVLSVEHPSELITYNPSISSVFSYNSADPTSLDSENWNLPDPTFMKSPPVYTTAESVRPSLTFGYRSAIKALVQNAGYSKSDESSLLAYIDTSDNVDYLKDIREEALKRQKL
ncbi:phosphoprotein [Salmon aquaparamyxovirus]|uniref:Phosphoprotein n=1 Tax=Salmon aquaparamyxovirus TaxID=381543 RepID=A0A3G2KTG0_9MONO|nr:phosphoprotein [Salmon aquaparamyxovirus]